MRISYIKLFAFAISMSCFSSQAQEKLTPYVDPFIGTGGHGHTYPGATVPFSLVQLSPDNGRNGWDWVSGYHYSDSLIAGFSHMHLNGTGIGDWLDISVMPLLQATTQSQLDTRVKFSHDQEKASPGFYQVKLNNDIQVSLTSTARVGFHRYEFPTAATQPTIRFDLDAAYNWDKATDTEIQVLNDSTIVGYRYSKGWANVQRIYFAARTNKAFNTVLLNGKEVQDTAAKISSITKGVNAQLVFSNSKNILLKVALSTTDVQQALSALQEIPHWDFEQVKLAADNLWEHELQKLKFQVRMIA